MPWSRETPLYNIIVIINTTECLLSKKNPVTLTLHGCSRHGVAPGSLRRVSHFKDIYRVGGRPYIHTYSQRRRSSWKEQRTLGGACEELLRLPACFLAWCQQLASHLMLTILHTALPYFLVHERCQSSSLRFRRVDKRKINTDFDQGISGFVK